MWNLLKKFSVYILAFCILITLLAVKHFQPSQKGDEETFTIGVQSGYPPFEFMDSKGEIIGFDVDVSKIIADKLEKKLVVKDMDFEGLILSLKQGKIDMIASGMNITPTRLKEILMIPYHGEAQTSLSLIFWGEIPSGVSSIEEIAKLPQPAVSVEAGTISEIYLTTVPNIEMKAFQGALAPLMDVKFGKSVANLVEPDVAEYLKKKHPEIKILSVPLPKETNIQGFGLGIKKENGELSSKISRIIQELKDSGELKKIENKWFGGES